MEIQENCSNWKINFTTDVPDNPSDMEKAVVKQMLHFTGDTISAIGILKEGEEREAIFTSMILLFNKFKSEIIDMMEDILVRQSWVMDFNNTEIFGKDLITEFFNCLKSEEDVANVSGVVPDAVQEMFNEEFDDDEEDDEQLI